MITQSYVLGPKTIPELAALLRRPQAELDLEYMWAEEHSQIVVYELTTSIRKINRKKD